MNIKFCIIGDTSALKFARNHLTAWGYEVVTEPDEDVTHVLLPVPSLDDQQNIRGGRPLEEILQSIPSQAVIVGGMLPQLPYQTIDLLKDEFYTAENASITAHCAVALATQTMDCTWKDTKVLIIGWGRIGKCLSEILKTLEANLTVAARKESDRKILQALGYQSVEIGQWKKNYYTLVINTVPAPVFQSDDAVPNASLIDLASKPGILGNNVEWARGLPNKMAPEFSGKLIAKTALRYALRKE